MTHTRPSILFINRVYPQGRGATGRMMRDLAHGFAREGWQVHVLTTGPQAMRELDGPVKVTRVKGADKPGFLLGYPLVWLKLLWAQRKIPKVDLVISMTDPPLAVGLGALTARRMKAKHIHWCQDLYPDVLPALGIDMPNVFQKALDKLAMHWMGGADKVVAIGRCMGRALVAKGLPSKKITVIPNWPDFELTEEAVSQGVHGRPLTRIERVESAKPYADQIKMGQKFRVLYAGNIGLGHPLNAIMEAAKTLHTSNPEIEFVFVGEGARFSKIADYRAEYGLENIRLLPYQPNSKLREVMESGDIHLISMRKDAAGCMVPSKIYSAMAVGRPTIFVGPAKTEVCKILRDFGAGIQVNDGDGQALVQAILQFRNDGDAWFAAHDGAKKAGEVFIPRDSIDAWINRALKVIGRESEIKQRPENDYAAAA